jgi:hypothetical protein
MARRVKDHKVETVVTIRIDHVAVFQRAADPHGSADKGMEPRHRAVPALEVDVLDACPFRGMGRDPAAGRFLYCTGSPDVVRMGVGEDDKCDL